MVLLIRNLACEYKGEGSLSSQYRALSRLRLSLGKRHGKQDFNRITFSPISTPCTAVRHARPLIRELEPVKPSALALYNLSTL